MRSFYFFFRCFVISVYKYNLFLYVDCMSNLDAIYLFCLVVLVFPVLYWMSHKGGILDFFLISGTLPWYQGTLISGKDFNFSQLIMKLVVNLHFYGLYYIEMLSSIHSLLRVFMIKGYRSVSNALPAIIEMIKWFLSFTYHTD